MMTQTQNQINANDVVNFLAEHGNIDIDAVRETIHYMNLEKIITESTGHTIWQGTDGKWRAYVYDADAPKHRKMIVRTDKRKLLDYLVSHVTTQYTTTAAAEEADPEPPKAESDITMQALYPSWKIHKGILAEETYIMRIESDWKKFYQNDPIILMPMRSLTKLQLEEWLMHLITKHHLTKTAYYNVTLIIRQMFEYAVDAELLHSNTFSKVRLDLKKKWKKPRKAEDHTQIYYDDEVGQLVRLAWEDYRRDGRKVYMLAPLAVIFELYCGLRISEVPVLKYSDIEGRTLHVQRMLVRDTMEVRAYTKGSEGERMVYLSDHALEIIRQTQEYRKSHGTNASEYIFSLTNEPIPWRTVNEYLERYCKRLDIPFRSSHKLRKTAISSLVNAGISLNAVRQFAGHVDERTTLRYYTYDRDSRAEKDEKFEVALAFGDLEKTEAKTQKTKIVNHFLAKVNHSAENQEEEPEFREKTRRPKNPENSIKKESNHD